MDTLFLEFPTKERKSEALEYIQEFYSYNSPINGTGGLDTSDYDSWIAKTIDAHKGMNVPSDRVAASTYFLVRESDNRIVGMVNIRHYLNEFLISHGYGHIGYSVRPLERKKGYATELLRLALQKCSDLRIEDVHIGCYKDNRGSYRTIEKNGGTLYKEHLDDEGKWNLEYIIKL